MMMEEEYMCSESESESDSENLYDEDPVFESREELERFMNSCDLSTVPPLPEESVTVSYDSSGVEYKCTCSQCEIIWSGTYQHLCCHQVKK